MTVTEVLEAVGKGELTASEALELERAESRPRTTLITQLEAMMAEKTDATEAGAFVTVKVDRSKVSRGAFTHPVSKATIGDSPVEVPDDTWTQDYLAKRFIKEV